jgi:hypothetical protein
MGRSRDDFIERTGGFRIDEPMSLDPSHRERIRELEERLKSGTLSLDEVEKVHRMICNLKGLPPDEWDYEPSED